MISVIDESPIQTKKKEEQVNPASKPKEEEQEEGS